MRQLRAAAAAFILLAATPAVARTVFDTTLGEADQKTAEVSTQELRTSSGAEAPSSWMRGRRWNMRSATYRER